MSRVRVWLAAACTVCTAFTACSPAADEHERALLIGIDGATLRVIEPLLEQGRLPNLAAIARAGVYGPLRSAHPLHSPAIWTSIATGKTRAKHGIKTFVRKDASGERRLYRSVDRRSHALWNIASDAGFEVGVVNWWVTFPVEEIAGVMVSDHAIPGQLAARAGHHRAPAPVEGAWIHPAEYLSAIEPLLSNDSPLDGVTDPFASQPETERYLWRSLLEVHPGRDARVVRIAQTVDELARPDVLMVFLKGIDPVSHTLYGFLEPEQFDAGRRPPADSLAAGAEALHRYYEYTDALIGRLVERYGPRDLVMVVSDHGFEAGPNKFNGALTGKHGSDEALDGVLFARGRGIAPDSKAVGTTIFDVTPTILAWLGLPIGEDMDGSVASFLIGQPVESIATHDTGAIRSPDTGDLGSEEAILEYLRSLGYIE